MFCNSVYSKFLNWRILVFSNLQLQSPRRAGSRMHLMHFLGPPRRNIQTLSTWFSSPLFSFQAEAWLILKWEKRRILQTWHVYKSQPTEVNLQCCSSNQSNLKLFQAPTFLTCSHASEVRFNKVCSDGSRTFFSPDIASELETLWSNPVAW